MTNSVGMTALLYGKTYLDAAIRSIIDSVEEYHVLYAARPSHGHPLDIPAPDSEDELHEIAWQAAGSKLRWHVGTWVYEHEQRGAIHQVAPDADVIVIVDSDEVYEDGLAADAIAFGLSVGCRQLLLPFTHLWRSFSRGFAHDPAYPTRLFFPKQHGETVTLPTTKRVWHYGYAQPSAVVQYKMQAHGHFNEFRRDVNWFQEVYMANRQYDCHPIGSEYWNVEAVDLTHLPSVLQDHPLRNVEVIE